MCFYLHCIVLFLFQESLDVMSTNDDNTLGFTLELYSRYMEAAKVCELFQPLVYSPNRKENVNSFLGNIELRLRAGESTFSCLESIRSKLANSPNSVTYNKF